MSSIFSSHNVRLSAPTTAENTADKGAWLAQLCDSSWRTLADFRNWSTWMPQVRSATQKDSAPPARGTLLQVDLGHAISRCSIDHWDPPRRLQISMSLATGEIAYGFLMESHSNPAELSISLDLEQSLIGISNLTAFFFKWRLQRLGRQIMANLEARIRSASGT